MKGRQAMLGAAHIRWKQLRADLHHPSDESREELLDFVNAELKVNVASLKDLSNPQLARLLDALSRELETRPKMPVNVVRFPVRQQEQAPPVESNAKIEHLAGSEQLWAIDKLFDYLGWTAEGRAAFIASKFDGRQSAAHLRPRDANTLLWILLRSAASRDLKAEQPDRKVTKALSNAYIPELKNKLGIDTGAR